MGAPRIMSPSLLMPSLEGIAGYVCHLANELLPQIDDLDVRVRLALECAKVMRSTLREEHSQRELIRAEEILNELKSIKTKHEANMAKARKHGMELQ
jgi:hypothetical protein